MKKTPILVLLAIIVLASCNSGGRGGIVEPPKFREGTNGIVIEYLPNSPPNEMYEGTRASIKFSLHNKGATDVRGGTYALAVNPGVFLTFEDVSGIIDLKGRSESDTIGEKRFYEFNGRSAELPSMIETITERVSIHTCYKYETRASTAVCVDTDVANEKFGKKVCQQKVVSLSGGQGGPIAVESVDLTTLPHDSEDKVLPQVIIKLRNAESGDVSLPRDANSICKGYAAPSSNNVNMRAFLSERPLVCSGEVLFQEDTAEVFCQYPAGIEKILGTYLAPLRVELDYGYHQESTKVISIKKLA